MAKKKQEQQEQSQDEHVMAILDKRTNKTAVVSKMNEQDGSLEIVPPDKKNSSSFLKLDRTSPLELFFTSFFLSFFLPSMVGLYSRALRPISSWLLLLLKRTSSENTLPL